MIVEEELDDTLVISDEEEGLPQRNLALMGGKLPRMRTMRSIDLVDKSEKSETESVALSFSVEDVDFGMGRVNIRPVDLDKLTSFSDAEVI